MDAERAGGRWWQQGPGLGWRWRDQGWDGMRDRGWDGDEGPGLGWSWRAVNWFEVILSYSLKDLLTNWMREVRARTRGG